MRWGTGSARRLRGNSRKALLLGLAVALVGAGVAVAAGGLVNASFENGLSGWTARTIVYTSPTTRAIAYEGAEPTAACEGDAPDETRVCLIEGGDDFLVNIGGNFVPVSVSPFHGSRMVRLGGPFTGAGNRQDPNYRPEVLQPFVVDPADPVVRLAYNVYSWDFPPYDSVELRITLTSEAGAKIADIGRQAPTGPGELNSTGWQPATFDLGAFKGQTVFLRVSAGGTVDTSLPTWAYVDGLPTTVTGPPPANPVVTSAKRPPCQGLKGKRRAKCQIEQQVKKKCDSKRGKRKKACAARVRAVAKCKALPTKSKRQRAKRSRCLALVKSGAGTKKGKQGKRKR